MSVQDSNWIMLKPCVDCPFNKKGPGARLARSLRLGRMHTIKLGLMRGEYFSCHKTTEDEDEDDEGRLMGKRRDRVCRGAYEWQIAHRTSSQYIRVCERIYGSPKALSKVERSRLSLR